MPKKPILIELVAILNLSEFKNYFKGTWELWDDDKVAYNFDDEKYLPSEIIDVYEFMKEFVAQVNRRLKSEIWFVFKKETAVFDFDITESDAEKVPGLNYGHIKKFINQRIKKSQVDQVIVEFLEALSQHGNLNNFKLHFSENLKNKLSKELLVKMQVYGCSIVTVNGSNDVEIYIPEKTREIEIFLRRMKNGIALFRLFSKNLPTSFIDFNEDSGRLLLKFSDLQLFAEKCPGFSIRNCLSNAHSSLNLPDLQQKSVSPKKSESWSPEIKSNLPEEEKSRERSESDPRQNSRAKVKSFFQFFKEKLFFKTDKNSTSSDEEREEYSATSSNS